MIRLIRNIIFLTVVCVVLLFVYRENLLKFAVKQVAVKITGLSVDVAKLKVGIFRPVLDMGGFKIYNPSGFPDKLMMDMPELYVHYTPSEILKGNIDLKEVRLSLEEFDVVKTKEGATNIARLKALAPPKGEGKAKMPPLKIGLLKLKVGRVVYKDYSVTPPSIKTYSVNIDKEYRDITDPAQLVKLIVFESLSKTSIQGLADVDLQSMKQNVASLVSSQASGVTGTLQKLWPFNKK